MPETVRLSAVSVEELDHPRPHYRVDMRGAVKTNFDMADPTAGLLPDEVLMTVRVPVDIGSDLNIIKKAATRRALTLLAGLMGAEDDHPASATTASQSADIAKAEAG